MGRLLALDATGRPTPTNLNMTTNTPCRKCGETERYTCGSCKRCTRERTSVDRKNNLEKRRAQDAARRRAQPERWREYQIKSLYGITSADYEQMLSEQNGVCVVCGGLQTDKRRRFFCIDHDHVTGKIRGLLCYHCNLAAGYLKDRAIIARKLAEYLEQ